jgi:hypothetical protein
MFPKHEPVAREPENLRGGAVMQVGEVWAYRERVSDPTSPLIPAEIVQLGPPKTQKARVRWQGGEYPGLDEWVTKRRLVVPWDQADAWLRDERLFALAREASMDADPIEHRAAWEILYVHPIPDGILLESYDAKYGSTVEVADLAVVCNDLQLDMQEMLDQRLAFVDMRGHYIAPWAVARRLALRVAERHTEHVLARVAKEEKQLQESAVHGEYFRLSRRDPELYIPPERCAERLREDQPVFGKVREWCGRTAVKRFDELAELRAEVVRLRDLIEDAVRRLREAGHPHIAKRLLNEMNRPHTNVDDFQA